MVDWSGDEFRNFGRPAFIENDLNHLSERGLLTADAQGQMFLAVGVAIEIPQHCFDIFDLLGVSIVHHHFDDGSFHRL